jgi:hypothetical protein
MNISGFAAAKLYSLQRCTPRGSVASRDPDYMAVAMGTSAANQARFEFVPGVVHKTTMAAVA